MKLHLIRHTSVDIKEWTCYGQTDVPVAQTFDSEAQVVRAAISEIQFDAVYSSPLTRCRLLAAFCGYPTPILDDRIKELNFGKWEMLKFSEVEHPGIYDWCNHFVYNAMPGGESFHDMYLRVSAFLDQLKQKDYNNVLIFAHGGVLACAQVYIGRLGLKEAFENLIPYGGMIEIEI